MSTVVESIYAIEGRARKVARLVSVLRKAGMTAAETRASDDLDWLLAAQAAGVAVKDGKRKPSEATRALVIERLEAFEAPPPRNLLGRCEVCDKGVYSDEPNCASFGQWFYHTRCWNETHAKDAGWQR